MSASESKSFEIDLQLIAIGNDEFMIPMPSIDRSIFPTEGMQAEQTPFGKSSQERDEKMDENAPPTLDEVLDVSAVPVDSSFGTPVESGKAGENNSRYAPTLVIERPKSEGISLDMPNETDWKVTVRKPEEKKTVSVPKRRLSKLLLFILMLFVGFATVYWMKLEPVYSKTRSILNQIALSILSKTQPMKHPEQPTSLPTERPAQESQFKKEMREHLKRMLGE